MIKTPQNVSLLILTFMSIFFTINSNAKDKNYTSANSNYYSSQTSNSYNIFTNDPVPIGRPGLMENCKYAYRDPEYLNPPDPVCTFDSDNFSTQVANGCPRGKADIVGNMFALSVMGVYFPTNINPQTDIPEYWRRSCTATVISRDWLITAAHCVAGADENDGRFYPEEARIPLYIVPVQKLKDGSTGVVPRLDYSTALVEKYAVEKIYIAYHYNYYNGYWPTPYPGHDYVKQDFALLKIKNFLPEKYKSIDLATDLPQSKSQIWFAGLGVIQGNNIDNGGYPYQRSDNNLNYRNMFYMTSSFPFNNSPYYNQNLGEIYTLGTLPVNAGPNNLPSAWKFTGMGDSGGAFFNFDPNTYKLSIIGILTGGTDCTWAGFMAPLPYSYTHGPSIPANKTLIDKIIRNTASDTEVRYISPFKNAYVLTQGSAGAAIYNYDFNVLSGSLSAIKYQKPVGVYPVQLVTNNGFVYVADYMEKTIFVFRRDTDGRLIQLPDKNMKIPLNLTDMQVVNGQYLIAIGTDGGKRNKILQFEILADGSLVNKKSLDTRGFPVSLATATLNGQTFIYTANIASDVGKQYSVSIYELDYENNNNLRTIQQDFFLYSADGQPIKIVADAKNHVFILRSGGIDAYKFNDKDKRLSMSSHYSQYYSLRSDMILLSDGSLVTSGDSLNQYKITDINDVLLFDKKTIDKNNYIGLAQGTKFGNNRITTVLYAVNDQAYMPRSVTEFTLNLQSNFELSNIYNTGDNPSKIIISK